MIENREFHSQIKENELYKPLISGRNITRFNVSGETTGFIKYGNWLGAMRDEFFFTKERIIVRQIISGTPYEYLQGTPIKICILHKLVFL